MKKFDRVFKHYDKFIELFNLNKMDEIKDVLELQGDEVDLRYFINGNQVN